MGVSWKMQSDGHWTPKQHVLSWSWHKVLVVTLLFGIFSHFRFIVDLLNFSHIKLCGNRQ